MVQRSSSPASPVTITITSGNKASGVTHRRSTGPSSPASGRPFSASNTTTSPTPSRISSGGGGRRYSTAEETESTEFVRYTVQIPATPEHHHSSAPPEPAPVTGKSYISGTLFTGGFNCVTRGHVLCSSSGSPADPGQCKMLCQMKGCDGDPFYTKSKQNPCECGYLICKDCYFDCLVNGGKCPGCKEIYREKGEEDCGFDAEEEVLPLTSVADFGYGRRLSMMKSVKGPADFDHSRWLFETKGTYGYGNAVWPKDGCRDGGGGARGGGGGFKGFEEPPNFSCNSKRPLTRKISVSQAIISPYRLLIVLRLVALGFFLSWRIRHPNPDAIWLWAMSIACELWFAVSWLLDQLPKLCPVNRATDLSVLKERFESPSLRNPKGRSDLPGIDVFVSTADPEKEPPLATANTVLSILAVDYPVEKLACYLSDDGGSLLTFEALAETASFAKTWVPFCRKHEIEPRNPEAYFSQTKDFIKNKVRLDFVRERRRVKREYDEFRVRINSLPESIRRRSDAFNAHEDLRAKKKHEEFAGAMPEHVPKATWMSDGSHWPGTWSSGETEHSRGDHAGIIQAMLAPPNSEPELGNEEGNTGLLINTSTVDIRLPMLVYVSREKRPSYDHNKKAGAMNALVRTSAIMSNGPFILNLDCDHYIHNSQSLREGMCFMLDSGGDRVCFVQFPQRFEGIDPNDRYANHNLVFFDVTMRAMDGLQGPMYVGTGCIFRRTALYGFSPPRATERRGWLGKNKKKIKPTMWNTKKTDNNNTNNSNNEEEEVDEDDVESCSLLPKMFGNSSILSSSIPIAEFQGRLLQDLPGNHPGRPAGSLAVPREPLDASAVAEAISVISSHYEAKTEWGKRVGWIYGSVTEDVVTGYRMHNRGWRSIYCVTKRDAFRGTAPINLTDRLHQVLRWATGSVEIFFSRNNALFATNRMKVLQRIAYFNAGMYPFTSIFLLIYCVLPAVSLFSGKFIVQSFSVSFLVFLLVITITLCLLALLEIKWSGITLHDWWRNEQFWVIGGTSAHPAAVVQGLLKVIAGVEISFTLTSKPGGGDEDAEEFAEMYVVRWSLLMVTPVTIMMVNVIAMAVAFGRTMYSEAPRWSEMVGGLFFSLWVLCHLYPFGKGLLGRKGKVPTIVFVWAGLISIVVSLLWVYVSPPQGARNNDYMSF